MNYETVICDACKSQIEAPCSIFDIELSKLEARPSVSPLDPTPCCQECGKPYSDEIEDEPCAPGKAHAFLGLEMGTPFRKRRRYMRRNVQVCSPCFIERGPEIARVLLKREE